MDDGRLTDLLTAWLHDSRKTFSRMTDEEFGYLVDNKYLTPDTYELDDLAIQKLGIGYNTKRRKRVPTVNWDPPTPPPPDQDIIFNVEDDEPDNEPEF